MATINLTGTDFETQVLQNSLPVLVDFWAEWCAPCKTAGSVLEELSGVYKDKLVIIKVNVDQNQTLAGKYQVMSIPTVILFKQGQEIARLSGFSSKEDYEELIKKGLP